MNILVSACLLGVSCRYDGDHNYDPSLKRIAEEHHLIPVCPESYGGLPVPRDPAEISKDRVFEIGKRRHRRISARRPEDDAADRVFLNAGWQF